MRTVDTAVGGYFELELPSIDGTPYQQALRYQSARAAFLALLRQSPNVKRVFMPYYICDAMLAPVKAAGKDICFYGLDERLAVNSQVTLGAGDLLLYVNYFGICTKQYGRGSYCQGTGGQGDQTVAGGQYFQSG